LKIGIADCFVEKYRKCTVKDKFVILEFLVEEEVEHVIVTQNNCLMNRV